MKKYYEIENLEGTYESLEEAKEMLEKVLHDEANYNYSINKNNSYSLLEVNYNESTEEKEYYEILSNISVAEYKNMNLEEKNNYFQK